MTGADTPEEDKDCREFLSTFTIHPLSTENRVRGGRDPEGVSASASRRHRVGDGADQWLFACDQECQGLFAEGTGDTHPLCGALAEKVHTSTGGAAALQRSLGRFQHAHHAQGRRAVGERALTLGHALDEVAAFHLQGLDHGHLRNVNVAIANGKELRVLGEGRRPVDTLVIDAQLPPPDGRRRTRPFSASPTMVRRRSLRGSSQET